MSRSKNTEITRKITDRKALMGFGKYSRETVQDILDNAPEYFLWLDANTSIEIASDILAEADKNSKPDHTFRGYTERDITNAVGSIRDFMGDD